MIYKVCIIDDEIDAQLVIQKHLENNFPEIEILAMCSTIEEAKLAINRFTPDFVFLDIQLGNDSGLELAKSLIGTPVKVIFTTAFEKYAIEAIRLKAIEYLLKPVFKAEFVRAINAVINEFDMAEQIPSATLSISSHDGIQIVPLCNIVYLEAEGAYCRIHLLDGSKIVASKPLGHFDGCLDVTQFFRCHKSFVVGIVHIKHVKADHVELSNGYCLQVSRQKRTILKKLLNV